MLTGLPMQHSVRMAWWHVPRAEVPEDREDRLDWLYAWWERIDTWIEDHDEPGLPGSRGTPAPPTTRPGVVRD